jgi:hypothetical protein
MDKSGDSFPGTAYSEHCPRTVTRLHSPVLVQEHVNSLSCVMEEQLF